jgi:hypothetical protein
VARTIELNREPFLGTKKIDNSAADGRLPAEFKAAQLAIAQARPEQAFSGCSSLTQCSGRGGGAVHLH